MRIRYYWKRLKKKTYMNRVCYFIKKPFVSKNVNIDVEKARRLLNSYCKTNMDVVCYTEASKKITNQSRDLDIIIPAYNVEAYIDDCISSVLNQVTSYSYRVLLIDDGSTDSTSNICNKYSMDNRITVIHKKNEGISNTRNKGLELSDAQYIMFLDSDDKLFDSGMIQNMLDVAYQEDADLVQGGYYSLCREKYTSVLSVDKIQKIEHSMITGYPWGKIFRASLFDNIKFPSGYRYEDSIISYLVVPKVVKAFEVPNAMYVYRVNPEGETSVLKKSEYCVQTYWITELMLKERERMDLQNADNIELLLMILRQIKLNYNRTYFAPKEIKESIFVLSCQLIETYFKNMTINSGKLMDLDKALKNKDYGLYRLYCEEYD